MLKKFIGTKQFYAGVWFIAMPIIVQNVITNLVNLLDNIMVGQVGTEPMSGVAIVNQLIWVFNLGVFGLTSGVGILTTQYFGKKDHEGVGNTFKIKFIYGAVFLIASYIIFYFLGDTLIWHFLHEGNEGFDLQITFNYAKQYLKEILWGLPFFTINQIYGTTLRDTKETKVPMLAGLAAVFINLVFNYFLIYGKFGFPCLGIVGAAIATNISRIIESGICVIWTHTHTKRVLFAEKVFHSFKFPKGFSYKVALLAVPAFFNEILWSFGQTMLNQSMSLRGVEVISAINITNTVTVLSKSIFLSMGVALAILVGNALGSGDSELAVDTDNKMVFLSFSFTVVLAIVVFVTAGFVPALYNTTDAVKDLSATFIRVTACLMPMEALINAFYHTIKSGGRPVITFFYDGGYTWIVSVPVALFLAHKTALPIVPMYTIIFAVNIIKLIAGFLLVRSKIWVRNLVKD